MALNITTTLPSTNGQRNLPPSHKTVAKALPPPASDSKGKENAKAQIATTKAAPPEIKINFSTQGREAAAQLSVAPAQNTVSVQAAVKASVKAPAKAEDAKAAPLKAAAKNVEKAPDKKSAPLQNNAKVARQAEELTTRIAAPPQPTPRADLRNLVKDTKAALKRVEAGPGAAKEIGNIARAASKQVQEIAKNYEAGNNKQQQAQQKEIARTLKTIDRLANTALKAAKKSSNQATEKANPNAKKEAGVPVSNSGQKSGTSEVKATPVTKTDAKSKPPAEVKGTPSATAPKVETSKTVAPASNETTKAAELTKGQIISDIARSIVQSTKAVKAEASSQTTREASVAPPTNAATTKAAAATATNVGQTLLNQKGIVAGTGKGQAQAVASNLVSNLATPAPVIQAAPVETTPATDASTLDASTLNNEPLNKGKDEGKNTKAKKSSLFVEGGENAYEIAKALLERTDKLRRETVTTTLNSSRTNASVSDDSALKVLQQVINDVKSVRGHLLEFQTNSPANNYDYLSSPSGTLNTLSTIRDSDYAAQVAEFTKSQLQPNAALFSTTNNIPSLVELLLKNEVLT